MSTEFKLDEGLQRAIVMARAGARQPTVADTILTLLKRRPDLGAWDWIFDLRQPFERATPEELEQIARAFNAARSRQSYTVFISDDPETRERSRLMDTLFLDRKHVVVADLRAAHAAIPAVMRAI